MFKKACVLLLAILLTAVPVSEAKAESSDYTEYPLSGQYELTEGTAFGVTSSFPDTWTLAEDVVSGTNMFTITTDPDETGRSSNANIGISRKYPFELTEKDFSDFIEASQARNDYIISNEQIYLIDGTKTLFYDIDVTITDQNIDEAIAMGALSQELVNQIGRDRLKSYMGYMQSAALVARDGYLFIVTGTYYQPEDKAEVLDVMRILIENIDFDEEITDSILEIRDAA